MEDNKEERIEEDVISEEGIRIRIEESSEERDCN
jgi:hypothetical protein